MKVLIFGTSEFAVPVLEAVAARHDVAGVVTQPDRPSGRGHKLAATPVKQAALARGLRVFTPERLKPFAEEARALGADAFVVASYGRIVPDVLLGVVPIAFNVHPSLLPLYRGATPLQSAIRDGRTETGVTIIAMDAGMDTGDVLLQERTPLGAAETYGELHDRLAAIGARMAADALDRYERGALPRTPQNALGVPEAEIAATLTRPLRKEDLLLPASATAKQLVDFIRSLAPEPSGRIDVSDLAELPHGNAGTGFVRITKAHVLATTPVAQAYDTHLEPGRIITIDGYWFVRATDAWIAVDELVPAGGKKMPMAAYANGHRSMRSDLAPGVLRPLAEVLA